MTENVGTPTALEIDPPATRGDNPPPPAAVRKPYSSKVHITLWLMVVPSDSTTWKVSCWGPDPKPASSRYPFGHKTTGRLALLAGASRHMAPG